MTGLMSPPGGCSVCCCDKEWMILCGGDVWATSVARRALNHRHAAYQSPRATEVAPTICRAASAKGMAINSALPLPFDKLINGRVSNHFRLFLHGSKPLPFELQTETPKSRNAGKTAGQAFERARAGSTQAPESTTPGRARRWS